MGLYDLTTKNWRDPNAIIGAVAGGADKGVNYLLNIGPDPTGRVPQPCVDILQQVGKWMQVNSEAIRCHPGQPL